MDKKTRNYSINKQECYSFIKNALTSSLVLFQYEIKNSNAYIDEYISFIQEFNAASIKFDTLLKK